MSCTNRTNICTNKTNTCTNETAHKAPNTVTNNQTNKVPTKTVDKNRLIYVTVILTAHKIASF